MANMSLKQSKKCRNATLSNGRKASKKWRLAIRRKWRRKKPRGAWTAKTAPANSGLSGQCKNTGIHIEDQ